MALTEGLCQSFYQRRQRTWWLGVFWSCSSWLSGVRSIAHGRERRLRASSLYDGHRPTYWIGLLWWSLRLGREIMSLGVHRFFGMRWRCDVIFLVIMIPLCFSMTLWMHFLCFCAEVPQLAKNLFSPFLSFSFLCWRCCMSSHTFLFDPTFLSDIKSNSNHDMTSVSFCCITPMIFWKIRTIFVVARSANTYNLWTAWVIS